MILFLTISMIISALMLAVVYNIMLVDRIKCERNNLIRIRRYIWPIPDREKKLCAISDIKSARIVEDEEFERYYTYLDLKNGQSIRLSQLCALDTCEKQVKKIDDLLRYNSTETFLAGEDRMGYFGLICFIVLLSMLLFILFSIFMWSGRRLSFEFYL